MFGEKTPMKNLRKVWQKYDGLLKMYILFKHGVILGIYVEISGGIILMITMGAI